MIGRTISHYRILEKLGQGGMGEVYKAEDTLLARLVAIKVLRLDSPADSEGQDRLVREAQAAGRLAHPNIATIHDFLDVGGQRFIVMEYLQGKTLASRILERPLPIAESLDIASGIGAGLDQAHRRRVLHRDLKPENVILSEDGTPKILDFGLALLTDRSRITREGMSLGTAAYVSPEQARGDPQDERTDIWSLGAVLYEMVAGRRPFKGENPLSVLYQVQNEDPDPLTAIRSDVPMELERIVNKALRKDRSERYLRVEDMLVDLKTLRAHLAVAPSSGARTLPDPARRPPRHRILRSSIGAGALVVAAVLLALQISNRAAGAVDSLAILPLANAAPDTASEYLGEGISENLINSLSLLPRLKVIARSSAFEFRGLHRDARSIGRKLGVRAVLLGDVLEHGGRIRISAELVDVRDDRHLWGAEYDRPAGDLA